MTSAQALADQRHRAQMRGLLYRAADEFGLDLVGEPVFGWRDRTVGALPTAAAVTCGSD